MNKHIFMLGRQPALGMAELERVLGKEKISRFGDISALLEDDIDLKTISRFGGTQKVGRVIAETNLMSWPEIEDYIKSSLLTEILDSTEGKINLGVSCYNLRVRSSQINGSNIALKKVIKKHERPIRIVPNKEPELSTAQVLHNQLISNHGFELLVIASKNKLIFAKTISIQDIDAYANRDQNRPKRDARVGMLPPKLAQIMINLANPSAGSWVVDPFCGTGVILQESLLMGFKAYGTDIEPRMIDYSKINLVWLQSNFSALPENKVEVGSATDYRWVDEIDSIGTVVCETLLGKPLSSLPGHTELKTESEKLNKLITRFLENLAPQLKTETEICVAIPAWVTNNGFITLPLLDHLEKIGYNRLSFKNVDVDDLIYYRPNQIVARQLLVLSRK